MENFEYSTVNSQLIAALRNGDQIAFKTIYDLLENKLYHFVFSITKSEYISEEIVQKVFIRIWEQRNQLDLSKSFESFVYTMTRNLTFNYLRDAARRKTIRQELWANISMQQQEVENELIFADYKKIVDEIVQDLPPQKRTIYQLSKNEGKSNSEIAAMLGISSKTVKNHLWMTMSTIRERIKPYLEESILILISVYIGL